MNTHEAALEAAANSVWDAMGDPASGCASIARACIAAYLAASEAEGFVMVPVEPTFNMKLAGAEAISEDHMRKMANYDASSDCWPAMIAARPKIEGEG